MSDSHDIDHAAKGWPARPVILAIAGAAAALGVQQLLQSTPPQSDHSIEPEAWRLALASGIAVGAGALGFGLERRRWWAAVLFAIVVGTIAGMVFYWNGGSGRAWGDWRIASLFLSIAIAVPLFQTARDEGGLHFPYAHVHGNAWTNVALWFACWLFVGVVFALAWLLSSLFDLIGLHFLRDLLGYSWFNAILFGGAFGAALGLLRERDTVVRLLQRVVTSVLAVLAPVLGVGLLVFLAALPFTGLHALWDATRSTTPILLSCVIGALILANAVIGNGEDEEATNPVLRYGALALAVAILPLAAIAAIATGLRIDQYGLTPDRLWAMVFVALASAYGLAYFLAVLRRRARWAALVRPSNLRLAFLVSTIALFLATPLLSFNALSTADQVARLESAKISPEKFDWAALAFDFGDPGKAALKRLTRSKIAGVAQRAKEVATKDTRWQVGTIDEERAQADQLAKRLRVLPMAVPVPLALRKVLSNWEACGNDSKERCTLLYVAGASEAIAMSQGAIDAIIKDQSEAQGKPWITRAAERGPVRYRLNGADWEIAPAGLTKPLTPAERAALKAGDAAGKVEIRTVPARRVFVGGVPVGGPFD